jgi:LacI family transcriptional regulator
MRPTIKRIAELSGVSTGTVDRVLNRRGRVKAEVEERVLTVAQSLNYTPNRVAQGLALRSRKLTIGVLTHVGPTYINHSISEGLAGIGEAAGEVADFGISLIQRHSRDFDAESQVEEIKRLASEGITSLAITPINDGRVAVALDEVMQKGVSVFCFINDITTALPHRYIGVNNHRLGSIAAGLFNLLSSRKPMRIAVINPSPILLGNESRQMGFEETIKGEFENRLSIITSCIATNDDDSSYKSIKRMVGRHPDLDGVFFASGATMGGMRALDEFGLLGRARVIAVDLSEAVEWGLMAGTVDAVITQNTRRAGYRTIRAIVDHLIFADEAAQQSETIESDIIIREHLLAQRF